MFTEKCENIAFFLPAPKNFFRHKKVPNRQNPANPPLLPTLVITQKKSRLRYQALGHVVTAEIKSYMYYDAIMAGVEQNLYQNAIKRLYF